MVSIPACHAGDRGSIPRHGVFSFCLYICCLFLLLLWVLITYSTFYFIILLLMKYMWTVVLFNFRLSNGQSIQMVTALILQLVQCMVLVPNTETKTNTSPENETNTNKSKVGNEILLISTSTILRLILLLMCL